MQLLFKTSILQSNIPVFYTIFKTSENNYLAQTSASGMKAFKFTKLSGEWISSEGAYASHARLIGGLMDKHYREHIEIFESSNWW